jgi:hypothetical protein
MKVSLPSKDGYFYSICYAFGVVNFPRNALVSFARNGWSACAGMEWSSSTESPLGTISVENIFEQLLTAFQLKV